MAIQKRTLSDKMIVAWHKTDFQNTTHRKLKTNKNGIFKQKRI